jgi:hypothetical protein
MANKYIATTRFNEKTYEENTNYKSKIGTTGCLYGTPMKIKETIPLDSNVYVIEMNNSINKIEGIGLIINQNVLDKNYRIYDDMDYNRYIYKGAKHIHISNLTDEYEKQVIYVLEQLLFKGERHCKRAQGITALPDWITHNKYGFDFVQCIHKIFKKYTTISTA